MPMSAPPRPVATPINAYRRIFFARADFSLALRETLESAMRE
jgi:hypothetical protein